MSTQCCRLAKQRSREQLIRHLSFSESNQVVDLTKLSTATLAEMARNTKSFPEPERKKMIGTPLRQFAESTPNTLEIDSLVGLTLTRPMLEKFTRGTIQELLGAADSPDNEEPSVSPAEEREVSHYVERFSENFRKLGQTKQSLLSGYAAAKKHDGNLTPAKFFNS